MEPRTPDYYKALARDKKDQLLRKRAEAAVSRNEHMPIEKFTEDHLEKVEALYEQLKERNSMRSKD